MSVCELQNLNLTDSTYRHFRQYHADCKVGQFKTGESKFASTRLSMEILSWQTTAEQLFDYPHQIWLEVLFVDPDNVVSQIMFKSESLDNFLNLTLDLARGGKALGCGTTTARMSKRGELGVYYAVEFEWQPSSKQRVQELRSFATKYKLTMPKVKSIKLPELPA